MAKFDLPKTSYFLDGFTDMYLPKETMEVINSLLIAENLFTSAAREITTKLENLNDEFKHVKDRNPIHMIKARVKTPRSIIRKLTRRGFALSVESARENLTDFAGVRVICSYIDDVYLIVQKSKALTTFGRSEVQSSNEYNNRHLQPTGCGQFTPVESGQSHRLFQTSM